jgi:integrase
LLPETRQLLEALPRRAETVLTNAHGKPWTPMGLEASFCKARNAAGLQGLHLHDLRGSFVTRLVLAGLTDEEVAKIAGWSTKNVAAIREKYVDHSRIMMNLSERISNSLAQKL